MKKVLVVLFITIFLTGCGKGIGGRVSEEFITKMIDYSTYNTQEKNEENLPIVLEQYFSPEGYKIFVDKQMGFIYPALFSISEVKLTEEIKISQVNKIKAADGTQLKYEIQYILVCKSGKIKMKDEIAIKIDKKNKITEVIILNTSDVIHKLFFDRRIL